MSAQEAEKNEQGETVLKGSTSDLGDFEIRFTAGDGNRHPESMHEASEEKDMKKDIVKSMMVPLDAIWQAKGLSHISMDYSLYMGVLQGMH